MTVPTSIRARLAVVVFACVGFAALPLSAAAQLVGANLSGVVTDESGGALPGVTVTVTNRGNGFQVAFVTATDGKYRAVSLQPGAYEVIAELAGFTRQTRQLNLTVGADATLDLQLGVGVIEETVMVSGSASLVEVTRSQPSSAVIGEQIASLPVLERNFLSLAQLMPGAAPDQRPNRFSITKFGGAADQRNSFTTIIDGGDIDDVIQGNPTINLSQDAVQEFKVFRNQFDAQYGNALSAVVAVVSKSGTNQLHGTGYYFGRDDALNAKNAFARTKPEYQQGRVGGSAGGPLLRNKTFFFATYEYNDVNDVRIIALPASNPFATAENGTLPLGPHQSPLQHQARPPVQRAALAVRPLRVRRPVHPPQQQHHLGLAPGRRLQHHAQRGRRGHVDPVAAAGQQPAGAFPDAERGHAHPQHGGGGDPACPSPPGRRRPGRSTFPAPRPRSARRSTTTPPGTTSSWGATTPTPAAATSRTPTRPASSPSRPTCRSMRTLAPPGRSRW